MITNAKIPRTVLTVTAGTATKIAAITVTANKILSSLILVLMYSIAIPTKIPVKRANGNTIVVMNLEPLVTARAVNTIHTTN